MDYNKKPELTRYNSMNKNVISTSTYRKITSITKEKLGLRSVEFGNLEVLIAHKISMNQEQTRLS